MKLRYLVTRNEVSHEQVEALRKKTHRTYYDCRTKLLEETRVLQEYVPHPFEDDPTMDTPCVGTWRIVRPHEMIVLREQLTDSGAAQEVRVQE